RNYSSKERADGRAGLKAKVSCRPEVAKDGFRNAGGPGRGGRVSDRIERVEREINAVNAVLGRDLDMAIDVGVLGLAALKGGTFREIDLGFAKLRFEICLRPAYEIIPKARHFIEWGESSGGERENGEPGRRRNGETATFHPFSVSPSPRFSVSASVSGSRSGMIL